MNHGTCKFYNGDFHNTHCAAGVAYRDVTTRPDDINGHAFRSPCIDWDVWNKAHSKNGFDNELQAAAWAEHGHCDKREEPTKEEVAEWEAEVEKRTAEVVESLNRGVVPDGVIACGPSTIGICKCNCPTSCEHVWDSPVEENEVAGFSTVTCSRCGKWQMNHDMWVME